MLPSCWQQRAEITPFATAIVIAQPTSCLCRQSAQRHPHLIAADEM